MPLAMGVTIASAISRPASLARLFLRLKDPILPLISDARKKWVPEILTSSQLNCMQCHICSTKQLLLENIEFSFHFF